MSSVASTEDRGSFRSAISRYLPLIGWMGFISLASSASFSASNTSSILGPLLQWLFPSLTGIGRIHSFPGTKARPFSGVRNTGSSGGTRFQRLAQGDCSFPLVCNFRVFDNRLRVT